MALAAGTRLGTYEIAGSLGAGGMGEVYRATDTKLGREVAIKTLPATLASDPDRLARFEREAKLLAALNHAHIGAIYGLDEQEGTLYIAMELVEGETLEQKLKAGPLPVDDALRLALQIAEALEAAHEKGVVHRDLKPANIMVTADGQVKVLDFGLAKAFTGDPNQATAAHSPALSVAMTRQGLILGTAGYMSPEQASGQATDQRADIWAFGVVLYEMLTGLPLFSGESVPHILADVLRTDPDWSRLPKRLHPRIRQLLDRCLAKKPRNRYAGIADARVDIEAALNDPRGVTPTLGQEGKSPQRRPAARFGSAAGIALAGAAVAALAAWLAWPAAAPKLVTTFSEALPANAALRQRARAFALSPDGRHYVVNTNEGLLLRRMGELGARPIQGAEHPMVQPFFSPDGESVVFVDLNSKRIERIAVSGGASVPVGEYPGDSPLGASWAPEGSMFLSVPSGIYRVPATGGKPELVVKAEGGDVLYGPSLLPDGDSLLFAVSTGQKWDTGQIVVQSLSTGKRTTLVTGGNDPRYVPTGHIVYAYEDKLFGIAFDLGTLSVSGGSVPLVDGVARAGGTAAANFGIADNGTLVYVTGGTGRSPSSLVWVDRHGHEEPVSIEPGAYVYPRISPDGRRVALDDRNADDDIWIWDFAAETRTRLTTDEDGGEYPTWTNDGSRVAFKSAAGIQLQAANNTGTMAPLLRSKEGRAINPYFFAQDDKELVFRAQGQPSDDIGMIKIGSDAEPKPTWLLAGSYNERNAELSPDGRWMAYESNESGRYEIYVRPFPNVNDDRVLVSNNGGTQALWSRDGTELFYLEGPPMRLMSVSVAPTDTHFAFSGRTEVLKWPYLRNSPPGRTYDISPDGKRFLAISEGERQESTTRIVVIENWTEDLKRLVPTK